MYSVLNEATCQKIRLNGGILHAFLTLVLAGGEWSASQSSRFTFGERAPGTHLIWGLVGHRAGLVAVAKSYQESNPGTPAC